ncbi:putative glycolipid-binding domain-containing protein [Streptomyces sp. NPDC048383]|uniref:putative glycolipid-binding domain-containing protein n=1 Tax=Streptomyces sp. NPDC048383 TaxID=3155386 RepID=UPI003431A451
MNTRSLVRTWDILPDRGQATAWVRLTEGGLTARGRAVGLDPEPYWVTYALETADDYVTSRLFVTVETEDATRALDLRHAAGRWSADGSHRPDLDGALDCDLGLCPLTNTMPVLRHGLHLHPASPAHRFLMAWVSVPGLEVSASHQTYTPLETQGPAAVVRYESDGFRSDITFDDNGLVLDYPHLATTLTR